MIVCKKLQKKNSSCMFDQECDSGVKHCSRDKGGWKGVEGGGKVRGREGGREGGSGGRREGGGRVRADRGAGGWEERGRKEGEREWRKEEGGWGGKARLLDLWLWWCRCRCCRGNTREAAPVVWGRRADSELLVLLCGGRGRPVLAGDDGGGPEEGVSVSVCGREQSFVSLQLHSVQIFTAATSSLRPRQTLLFSATLPDNLDRLARSAVLNPVSAWCKQLSMSL